MKNQIKKYIKNLLEAVVLSQLPKEKRIEALRIQSNRKRAGEDILKKKSSEKIKDFHQLSPLDKEKIRRERGFGVGEEKKSKKRNYDIIRNSHTDPDSFYPLNGQKTFMYFPMSKKIFMLDWNDRDFAHFELLKKNPRKILEYLRGAESYSRLSQLKNNVRKLESELDEIMYDKDSYKAGIVNGRYLNGKASVWVYITDKDIENIVDEFKKRKLKIKEFHVPKLGTAQGEAIEQKDNSIRSKGIQNEEIDFLLKSIKKSNL